MTNRPYKSNIVRKTIDYNIVSKEPISLVRPLSNSTFKKAFFSSSFRPSIQMATSKPNKIDETHNMLEMAQVMIDLGISSERLTKALMDEMRNREKEAAIEPS